MKKQRIFSDHSLTGMLWISLGLLVFLILMPFVPAQDDMSLIERTILLLCLGFAFLSVVGLGVIIYQAIAALVSILLQYTSKKIPNFNFQRKKIDIEIFLFYIACNLALFLVGLTFFIISGIINTAFPDLPFFALRGWFGTLSFMWALYAPIAIIIDSLLFQLAEE